MLIMDSTRLLFFQYLEPSTAGQGWNAQPWTMLSMDQERYCSAVPYGMVTDGDPQSSATEKPHDTKTFMKIYRFRLRLLSPQPFDPF
jgi:hypothetical protein